MADDLDERAEVARAMCVAHGQNPIEQLSVEDGQVKPMWQTMLPLATSIIAGFDALAEYRARRQPRILSARKIAALRLAGYEVMPALKAKPVAFRVQQRNNVWAIFESEADAASHAMAEGTEYQGLYVRDGT